MLSLVPEYVKKQGREGQKKDQVQNWTTKGWVLLCSLQKPQFVICEMGIMSPCSASFMRLNIKTRCINKPPPFTTVQLVFM